MSSVEDIAIKAAFSFVTVVGVTGNILVCLVVLLNKPMRTSMNYLLVNLAISDMMMLMFFSPTFIFKGTYTHPGGIMGDILCSLITGETLAWIGGYVSSAFLLAISIERYFAVAHPHSYGTSFITKNLKILVSGCWLFSVAWNSVGFVWKRYDKKQGFCVILWTESEFKVYSMLSFFIVGFLPIVTMAILYSRVIYLLWFKNVVMRLDEERQKKKKKRATKMVLIVSLVYAICWLPELTVFVLFAYSPQSVKFEVAYPATVAVCCLNSAINPIIYSFHNNQFRCYLKKLVCGCCGNELDGGISTTDKSDVQKANNSQQLQVQSYSS